MLAADGNPSLLRAGSTAGEVLNTNSGPIAAGAIATDAASILTLALTPSTLVELRPSTGLKIVALSMRKDGNETAYDSMRRRDAHGELKDGTIFGSQERPDVEAEPVLTIDTAEGSLVSSFDSTFAMMRDQRGTRVVCASGLLYFEPRGQREAGELEGGSFGEWSADAGHVAAAESDAAAQA
ncbi:MAG: hypothetical protein M3Y69_08875, partial [Verrucomicrobiota bacterium]|nr:hypothetical protein [Verrucomicrobiota bacterium]